MDNQIKQFMIDEKKWPEANIYTSTIHKQVCYEVNEPYDEYKEDNKKLGDWLKKNLPKILDKLYNDLEDTLKKTGINIDLSNEYLEEVFDSGLTDIIFNTAYEFFPEVLIEQK